MLKILTLVSNPDHNKNLIDYIGLNRMASLAATTKSYRAKRDAVSRLRRQKEKKLKEVLSQVRRSNLGLLSLERRKEDAVRQQNQAAQALNQFMAQKESIERLKILAEERLRHEQDTRDEVKQQSEFGGDEEKSAASQRLKIVDDKIAELREEIKEREGSETRILNLIENKMKEKLRLDKKLRAHGQSKPGLLELLKIAGKEEAILRPQVQSLIKREAQTARILLSMVKKMALSQAFKRKTARKKVTRRAILKSKLRNLVRKKSRIKTKPQKRKASRKISKRNVRRKISKIKKRRS